MLHGASLGKRFDLPEGETFLGREEEAGIRIDEKGVSRRHLRFLREGSDVAVQDLGSHNGTFVNTSRVSSSELKDGDLLLVGNTILKFTSGANVEGRYHEEIYRMATVDGMTQAANKAFFLERLSEEIGRSLRYRRDLSLILFDFDHFKGVNDTRGHEAGDEVLRRSAFLILKSLRREDLLGRLGGEEFGIFLPETALAPAKALAGKLRRLVGKERFRTGGSPFGVTISLGVAHLEPRDDEVRKLLQKADEALYRAKRAGRDCVRA